MLVICLASFFPLPPLCKMVGTVGNGKQCKRIVNASSKDIYKGNALDGCTIAKYGHAKDSCFRQEQGHLLLPALCVDGVKVLATYKLPPWWLVIRTEPHHLNHLQQLGVFSQGKWKAVAVQEVCKCSIIAGAFGLVLGPQSFNCIIPLPFLAFFVLKYEAGVLEVMLEVSIAVDLPVMAGVQGCFSCPCLPSPSSSHRLITPPPRHALVDDDDRSTLGNTVVSQEQ